MLQKKKKKKNLWICLKVKSTRVCYCWKCYWVKSYWVHRK